MIKQLKNKIYYLVQYSDGDRLWIANDELIKDDLNNYIDDYETSQLPETYINMKVKKKFGKTFYNGIVEKYDKKNKWFKIIYNDNDMEDLNVKQLKKILVVKPKKRPITEIRKKV